MILPLFFTFFAPQITPRMTIPQFRVYLLITSLFFVAPACKNKSKQAKANGTSKENTEDSITTVPVNTDNNYNDFARFYAGYMPLKDSNLIRLTKDSIWIKHQRLMDQGFGQIEANRFSIMRKWRDQELKEANASGIKTMYYPLSGPDFLNAFLFFPNCTKYIMVALEPAGTLKDMSKMKRQDYATYMNFLGASMTDIFNRSYFITKKMSGDFSKWKLDGNLPTMLVFLARTGNTIVDIKRTGIDENGKLHEYALGDTVPRRFMSRGAKVYFIQGKEKTVREVYYFSMNLGDEEFNSMPGLDKNKGFLTWMKQQGDVVSYMKAASYLHHYGFFGMARNIVFTQSKFHLQDDSGIAYQFFDKKKWKFRYYGKYSQPISEFGKIYEHDLEKAYKTDSLNVKPLPFKLGYHWMVGTVNMLQAIRQ